MAEIMPDKKAEKGKKAFMVAQMFDPSVNTLVLWPMIKPLVEEIIASVQGEYGIMTIWAHIVGKLNSDVFVAYELPWDGEGEPDDKQMYQTILNHMLGPEKEQGFIGYAIREFDLNRNAMNLWQVYIKPEYQNTTAKAQGFEWFKNEAIRAGAAELTCSTYEPMMESIIKGVGFTPRRRDFYLTLPKKETQN